MDLGTGLESFARIDTSEMAVAFNGQTAGQTASSGQRHQTEEAGDPILLDVVRLN